MRKLRTLGVLTALTCSWQFAPALELPEIFSSNMVLQQQTQARIWGWAEKGAIIEVSATWDDKQKTVVADEKNNTITLGSRTYTTTADKKTGRWELQIPTPKASYDTYTMHFIEKDAKGKPTDEMITLSNIPYFSTDKKSFSDKDTIQIFNYHPYLPKGQKIESFNNPIYYTLDGSEPTINNGTLYTGPIVIDTNTTLKAISFNSVHGASLVAEAHYSKFNKDKSLSYITKPNPQYYAGGDNGLIDGIRGKTNWRVGNWQGFAENFEAVIDLQKVKPVTNVTISCLEDVRAWIFFPKKVTVYISNDGKNYNSFGSIDGIESVKDENAKLHDFIVEGSHSGRYLKIVVESYGKLPSWHVSAGQQSWLFIDEISIK